MPDSDLEVSRRHPVPGGHLTYEPSERWVRGFLGDELVVDTRRAVLVWVFDRAVPHYAFPVEDIRSDLLERVSPPPGQDRPGAVEWYDLVVKGERFEQLAWRYGIGPLNDHVSFDWLGRQRRGIDHWFEEEEEIFVHPRDPYKRVDALPSSRHVQIRVRGRLVAETRHPILLFETRLPIRYYIPPEDVDFSQLQVSDLQTRCPYKGVARYWNVGTEPADANIVWAYDDPLPAVGAIKAALAFYNEVVDITVDGVELPRPLSEFSKRFAARQ